MIEQAVRDQIAGAAPDAQLTVLATWTQPFDLSAYSGNPGKAELKVMAARVYEHIKRPRMEQLSGVEGLRIQDLPGSRSAILTARPAVLSDVFDRLDWSEITVEANRVVAEV